MNKIIIITIVLILIGFIVYYFLPEGKLPKDVVIDKIIVHKSQRKLEAFAGSSLMKTYKISLGKSPLGHKQYEGDGKTPEGIYTIYDKNPNSCYHKNLGIDYPNECDIENALQLGKSPGGQIKIHGLRNGGGFIGKFHRWTDWTQGCIALTDEEIEELYNTVGVGTIIEINP